MSDVAVATKDAACNEIDSSFDKIVHCLDQLSDEQAWWRPTPDMNSIANLMLHVSGNMRQWIVAGVGGADDTRNRPQEFAEQGPIAKAELLEGLGATIDEAKTAIRNASHETLLASRRIQAFKVTGIGAIFHSVAHLQGHVQEIVHLTRQQLGSDYKFSFVPTPEQGA